MHNFAKKFFSVEYLWEDFHRKIYHNRIVTFYEFISNLINKDKNQIMNNEEIMNLLISVNPRKSSKKSAKIHSFDFEKWLRATAARRGMNYSTLKGCSIVSKTKSS